MSPSFKPSDNSQLRLFTSSDESPLVRVYFDIVRGLACSFILLIEEYPVDPSIKIGKYALNAIQRIASNHEHTEFREVTVDFFEGLPKLRAANYHNGWSKNHIYDYSLIFPIRSKIICLIRFLSRKFKSNFNHLNYSVIEFISVQAISSIYLSSFGSKFMRFYITTQNNKR